MNLVQKAINAGGKLVPLVIKEGLSKGTGLMNPSIFIDDDGDILVNLRHVNYSLYHAEKDMMFPSAWGPLAYLHPEKDMHLRTYNYLCRLDKDLKIADYCLVDTETLDVPPLWEFVGLEYARVVKWDNKYYLIGVRRDTTTNGQGRMEYSEIDLDKKNWTAKEVLRVRIPTLGKDDSYCEKNWYPIIDKPYHFIKWTSPTEIVKALPTNPPNIEQVSLKNTFNVGIDQRGGSQMIPWNDYYISISHEVSLWNNYLSQKNGIYRHKLCVWDKDYNLIGLSPENFSFLDAHIEFCAGVAKFNDDLLITFGFSDNAAFVLKVPNTIVEEMIQEAIAYDNN
jgi:hypothetical protein